MLEASARRPVPVDFWAEWCSPCHIIAPLLNQVVSDLDGAVGLVRLDVEQGASVGPDRVHRFCLSSGTMLILPVGLDFRLSAAWITAPVIRDNETSFHLCPLYQPGNT